MQPAFLNYSGFWPTLGISTIKTGVPMKMFALAVAAGVAFSAVVVWAHPSSEGCHRHQDSGELHCH
jgi:hypothetical protein